MPKARKCAYCGKVFTTNSGMQKYCSAECAEQAKESKRKRQRDFLRSVEPMIGLQQQEYLSLDPTDEKQRRMAAAYLLEKVSSILFSTCNIGLGIHRRTS